MTLDKFLSTPNAAIILESKEDFKFLQKEFSKRNINWCNGRPFSDSAPHLEADYGYPVYITSNISWGYCRDVSFKKITTIIDLNSIDDFYDERITIEEFVRVPNGCTIHTPTENQALKLIDRFAMLGMTTRTCKPYSEFISSHNIQPYGDETCWSNKGTFGSRSNYPQVYEFDEIIFGITLTDFLNRNRGNGLRVIHCTTKEQAQLVYDAINNRIGMRGCPIEANIWYTNRGTYSSVGGCYSKMKQADGSYNRCFAPIYEFEEVDLSK